MKNKQLKIIVKKALEVSIKSKFDEKVLQAWVDYFKTYPRFKAKLLLKLFLESLKNEIKNRTLVVESSVRVLDKDLNILRQNFSKEFETIQTENLITPNLLGGLRVRIGDYIFEDSLKSRIEQVKEGIQNG